MCPEACNMGTLGPTTYRIVGYFEGENFHEFRGLTSIREYFPLENI